MPRWWPWSRTAAAPAGQMVGGANAGLLARRGGRAHLRGVPYVLPKDDSEMSRLDFQHYMLRYALRGNYAAAIAEERELRSILDVGCGTGRWAREMATLFPNTHVVGLDILPPRADTAADEGIGPDVRPPNYTYTQGNVLEGLPFAEGTFDFTHQRLLLGALPAARWPGDIQELMRVTRRGGWVELVECGVLAGGGPESQRIVQWNIEMCDRRGIDNLIAAKLAGIATSVGLANVTARAVDIPVGAHGGRLGAMAETDYYTLMSTTRNVVVSMGITTAEMYDAALAGMREDMRRRRCSWRFHIITGQRP